MWDHSGRCKPIAVGVTLGLFFLALALPAAGAFDAETLQARLGQRGAPDWLGAVDPGAKAADKSIGGTLQVAVGDGGTVQYNDGAGWQNLPDAGYPTGEFLYRVDALSLDNLWVCGENGVRSFDGNAWSEAQLTGHDVFSIMVRPDGVVACMTLGEVWRDTGSGWENLGSAGNDVYGVWGFSADDFWICGSEGLIRRYRHGEWTTVSSGTTEALYTIWGAPGVGPYFVGVAGTFLVYRDGAIHPITTGTARTMNSIHGTSATDIWICGANGRVWHYDGTPPLTEYNPNGLSVYLWGVSALPGGQVTVGGENGNVQYFDGEGWTGNNISTTAYLVGLISLPSVDNAGWWDGFARAPQGQGLGYESGSGVALSVINYGGRLVAHGSFDAAGGQPASNIAAFDGTAWEALPAVEVPVTIVCQSLATYSGDLVCVDAPGSGSCRIQRLSGSNWESMGPVLEHPVLVIKNLTIASEERLYIAGEIPHPTNIDESAVFRWNPQSEIWQPIGSGLPDDATFSLAEFGGDLFASLADRREIWRLAGGNPSGVWDRVFSSASVYPVGLFEHQGSLYVGCSGEDTDLLRRYIPGGSLEWQNAGAVVSGNGFIFGMTSWGDRIILSGVFEQLGSAVSRHVAYWENGTVHAFGSGLQSGLGVFGSAFHNGDIYFGGLGIAVAGTCESWGIARWRDLGGAASTPQVAVTAPASVAAGFPATISADVTSYQTVQRVSVAYRAFDQQDFRHRAMAPPTSKSDGTFQTTIPGSDISSYGLQYFVTVQTNQATVTVPANAGQAAGFVGAGVASDLLQEVAMRYELIGVPFVPLGNMRQILEDDLGGYDPSKWRLERWNPATQRYLPYSSVPPFAPGRGYYLIQRNPVTIDISGTTTSTVGGATIPLEPGWNMIAAPYLFSVPWAEVEQPAALEDQLIARVDDAYEASTTLVPWRGYFVYLTGSSPATLTVPAAVPGKSDGEGLPAGKTIDEPTELPGCDWVIAMAAEQGESRDLPKIVGALTALDGGPGDLHQPPSLPHDLSVWLEREETDGMHQLRRDLRLVGGGAVWDLVIRPAAGENDPVRLAFSGLERVPAGLQVALVSPQGVIDLRRDGGQWHGPVAGETRLRLVVGDPALIEQAASTLPQPYALLPAYPNPFNPSTTVVFTMPRQSRVRIDLFDVSGRRLRTLVDEVRGPGRHEAVWDGTGQDGRGISSGVYFARLRADGFEQTRKLTLVR